MNLMNKHLHVLTSNHSFLASTTVIADHEGDGIGRNPTRRPEAGRVRREVAPCVGPNHKWSDIYGRDKLILNGARAGGHERMGEDSEGSERVRV